MKWYIIVVKDNYANFNGRASRQEYWMFMLFNMIFAIIAMVADNILGSTFTVGSGYYETSTGYGWIYLLYILAIIIACGCSVHYIIFLHICSHTFAALIL